MVAAASYEARVFGIHSAMPSTQAQRLCPHAVFVAGDHEHYGEISERVMAIFRSFTPLVEAISLDEAFLDVTGARRLHGDGPTIAAKIRAAVLEQEQLTCSVGVAPSKFVAKLASEAAKPRIGPRGPGARARREGGASPTRCSPSSTRSRCRRCGASGPKTLEKLHRLGVDTVGDLAGLDERDALASLGRGQRRPPPPAGHGASTTATSIPTSGRSRSATRRPSPTTTTASTSLQRQLVRLGDSVAQRLRAAGVAGRTVTIKVRFHDFRTITRSVTLPSAVDTGPDVVRAATELLAQGRSRPRASGCSGST